MTRYFQYFNFAGILILVALCCVQWRANRQVNLRAIGLEKIRLTQVQKISEQEKTIKGQAADLDDFRQRLELSEAALKESQQKFNALAIERDKLIAERNQLKTTLDTWKAAVAQRDAAIKQASEQIQKLATERQRFDQEVQRPG